MSGKRTLPGARPGAAAARATASVLLLRALVAGAGALGLSLDELAEATHEPRAAFSPESLSDPDGRVQASLLLGLWEFLPTRCADESFGFWLAEQLQAAPLSVASWVISSSPTLGEGLTRSLRYQRLLHDDARSELRLTAHEVCYRHQIGAPPFRAPSAAIEFGFLSFLQLAQRITGQRVVPVRVRLQHEAPRNVTRHQAFFGAGLQFNAEVDELVLDRTALDLPLVGGDPILSQIVESHAAAALARLPAQSDVSSRVRAQISGLLREGTPSVETVCQRLRVSRRTLQRQLSAAGSSFVAELDHARHQLALGYLADPRISLQETAFLLGFSEASAFHRAFLRWTGETPNAWRSRTTQLARAVQR